MWRGRQYCTALQTCRAVQLPYVGQGDHPDRPSRSEEGSHPRRPRHCRSPSGKRARTRCRDGRRHRTRSRSVDPNVPQLLLQQGRSGTPQHRGLGSGMVRAASRQTRGRTHLGFVAAHRRQPRRRPRPRPRRHIRRSTTHRGQPGADGTQARNAPLAHPQTRRGDR